MKVYIYKITNTINNKQYIGQTIQSVRRRWQRHKSPLSKSAISLAIQKYGVENFTCETIDTTYSLEDGNKLEQFYIHSLQTLSPGGYNLDIGGRNCRKTPESIERGAQKKRGKAYRNRRRGIIAIHSITGHEILCEVVKDYLHHGFTKTDLSNIRWVLTGKSSKKRVRKYYFFYNIQANQNLIKETKKSLAVQRIVDEPQEIENISHHETPAPHDG